MFRTYSKNLVEIVVNHPDIRPTIQGGDYRLDANDVMNDTRNIAFACETGVVLFIYKEPGVYQLHGGFVNCGRGANAVAEVRNAIETVMSRFNARKVQVAVPLQLRAARMFCRLVGFTSEGSDPTQEHFVIEGGLKWVG